MGKPGIVGTGAPGWLTIGLAPGGAKTGAGAAGPLVGGPNGGGAKGPLGCGGKAPGCEGYPPGIPTIGVGCDGKPLGSCGGGELGCGA